jgi:hypothetical protein
LLVSPPMRCFLGSVALLSTVIACGGEVVPSGGAETRVGVVSGAAPGPTTPTPASGASPGVLATMNDDAFTAMAVDDTTLYLGRNGHIFSMPKTGGTPKAIFDEAPENQSDTSGMAVDDQYVYFTGTGAKTLSRLPKTGGPRQILATLEYPMEIAIDDTDVYVAVNDVGIARVPKAGGDVMTIASGQRLPQSIALAGDTVYFGVADPTDYQAGPNGAIRAVPKNGGDVTDVVTGVTGQPWHLALTNDAIFYVDYKTRSLMRSQLVGQVGGPSVALAGAFDLGIVSGRNDVYAGQVAVGSSAATFSKVDGQNVHPLASWSFPVSRPAQRFPGSGDAEASLVSVVDATHVYWVTYETNDRGDSQTTVRAAPR